MQIKGKSAIKSYSLKGTIHNIYKACHVKYKESKAGQMIEYTFTDPSKSEGMTLEVNEKVKTIAEAEKLAKKKLREKNCQEVTATISMVGDFRLMASNTVQLQGFHKFDAKYIIAKASHGLNGGYVVNMDLRKCLNGY